MAQGAHGNDCTTASIANLALEESFDSLEQIALFLSSLFLWQGCLSRSFSRRHVALIICCSRLQLPPCAGGAAGRGSAVPETGQCCPPLFGRHQGGHMGRRQQWVVEACSCSTGDVTLPYLCQVESHTDFSLFRESRVQEDVQATLAT